MNYPMKLMISGKSIAELAVNARKFLEEIDGTAGESVSQEHQFNLTAEAIQRVAQVRPVHEAPTINTPMIPPVPVAASIPAQQNAPVAPSNQVLAGASDLDIDGVPWDQRIHASSRTKTKDGAWRIRRGVEDDYVRQIEKELRQRAPAAATIAPPPPLSIVPPVPAVENPFGSAPPVSSVVASPAPLVSPQAFQPPQPLVPGPTAAAPIQAPAAALPPVSTPLVHTLETFKLHFVPVLTELVKQGKITQEYVGILSRHFNVEYLHMCNPEQIGQMFENFTQAGWIQKAQ